MRPWVVKIGGSLHDASRLPRVVRRVADFPHASAVVPGGGVFADRVRSSQRRWRFDDRCAHAMALLAMRQYGYLLAALGAFETVTDIRALATGAAPRVWLPDEAALQEELPPSWDLTSDSIAAWLACRLEADWLVLVKPVAFTSAASAVELVDAAFVDTVKKHATPGPGKLSCAMVSAEQWLSKDFSCERHRFVVD